MNILVWLFIIKALFCFSEGKTCPEKYRPHKTRCDAYFKCILLPSKSHVWMPAKCERGLIFEPNLKMCVLPGDDWECNLDENSVSVNKRLDENNIYGVDPLQLALNNAIKKTNIELKTMDDNNKITEFIELNNNIEKQPEDEEYFIISSDSELEKEKYINDEIESSGYGPTDITTNENNIPKLRENIDDVKLPNEQASSKVDPKLTSYLQRLSQLIDGLQKTYKTKGTSNLTELRPDQLNAFLAHFNIKNDFDSFDPINEVNHSENNKINSLLNQIKFKKFKNNTDITKPLKSDRNNSTTKIIKLNPETKVILKNSGYKRTEYNDDKNNAYSNSQIVVNRPEGSVTFTLTNPYKYHEKQNFNNIMKHDPYDYNTEPKISEETLKTVLELSKQMISNQNIRQVIPANAPGIYQPFIAPIYYGSYPPTSYYDHNSNPFNLNYPPIKNYHSNVQQPQHESIDEGYDKFSSSAYISNKKENYEKQKPSTTVIQNSVIPVHITTNSDKGIIERPETSTNSNNRYESYENYLNKISEIPTNLKQAQILSNDKINKNRIQNYILSSTTPLSTTTATTTELPFKYSPSPPGNQLSLLSFYTPNPHLDDSNANSIFESTDEDRYPIVSSNYQQIPSHLQLQHHKQQQLLNNYEKPNKFIINNRDSIRYQSNIKTPSSQSAINQQIMQQQSPILFNMGFGNGGTPLVASLYADDEIGHVNENEYNPSLSSSSSSLSSNYHQNTYGSNNLYNINKQKQPQFVTHQLAHQNVDQQYSYLNGNDNIQSATISEPTPTHTLVNSLFNNNYNGIKSDSPNAMVNLGGNFVSYDYYKNKLLPSLGLPNGNNNIRYEPNVEVVTCTVGIRQPNITDCTRYYVCSRKDSKVLSYSCPPYTAFNSESRICDAKSYSVCTPESLFNNLSLINNNNAMQLNALKALQDAKRIRQEAIQAQTFANLMRYQTEQVFNQSLKQPVVDQNNFLSPTVLTNLIQSYKSPETSNNGMNNYGIISTLSSTSTTTMMPILNLSHKQKKRKYYCKEGDKIPDQTSISNYFICYKNKDGAMRGHKMTCSTSLVFCSQTKLCTTAKNCS